MEAVMSTSSGSLPPGPRLPPALQLAQWVGRPTAFMEACAARFGDAFTLQIGGAREPIVFISHPEMVRDVFTGDPAVFHAGEANTVVKPVVGEHSVLLLDGPRHHRERRLLMPPFHGARMQAYGDLIRRATADEAATWKAGAPFPIQEAFQRISLEVILRAVFGLADAPRIRTFREPLQRIIDIGGKPYLLLLVRTDGTVRASALHERLGGLSPITRFDAHKREVDRLLFEEFAHRRETGARGEDILSLLLDARDEAGQPMTDPELRDELITLLVAGHETTATSLTWVLSEVLRRPDVLQRLRAEYAAVTGGSPVETKHVGKLEYTDAVIKETLRLNPILPIVVRVLKAPARVGPLELPANVVVAPCIYLAQRRKDLWGEDADQFRPERFLEAPVRDRKTAPFEWFPFGGGARRCIGMAFALFEMKVVLAELLGRHELKLPAGYTPKRVRRGITFAVSRGLPVIHAGAAPAAASA